MKTLIKQAKNNFIVFDTEIDRFTDWCYEYNKKRIINLEHYYEFEEPIYKIVYSTQPLETFIDINGVLTRGWNKVKMLKLSTVKRAIGEVDIDALAASALPQGSNFTENKRHYKQGYERCELENSHKRFRDWDLIAAYEAGYKKGASEKEPVKAVYKYGVEYLNSLKPENEWNVEISEFGSITILR